MDDDYGDESFDNSVHDSPPPVAKSGGFAPGALAKAPAPAPAPYISRARTAPGPAATKSLVADDDDMVEEVMEISGGSIGEDIDEVMEISG